MQRQRFAKVVSLSFAGDLLRAVCKEEFAAGLCVPLTRERKNICRYIYLVYGCNRVKG